MLKDENNQIKLPELDRILADISGVSYGSISFYDLYHGDWFEDYNPRFGKKASDAGKFLKEKKPENLISLTHIVARMKKISGAFLFRFEKNENEDEYIYYSALDPDELTFKSVFGDEWKKDHDNDQLQRLFSFLSKQRNELEWQYLYCFTPMTTVPAGVIFLFMNCELPSEYIQYFQILSKKLFLQLSLGMSIALEKKHLKKHGSRAAAASIIGRNMSHNIGSHVIYYLSNSFQNSDRNPFDKILKEFIGKCKQKENPGFQQILKDFEGNDKVNTFEKFYDNMSTFLNYLQARMDYVALAGTIEPGYGQGMKTKDLMEEFEDNKFLIEGIAQSEDVKAIKIKERKASFQGLITVPFGEIGKHAFFSILENIIRNSAKHGHDKIKDGKLSLYYKATKNNDNGMIDLEIYDELGTWEKAEETMHLSETDKEQSATESPLIDDDGSLVHAYMGIKEMKISAAFLRMIPFYEIDSEKYKSNRLLKLDTRDDSLMYKIRLLPYKNLLIVTEGNEGLSSVNEEWGIDKASIEYLRKQDVHVDEYKIAVSDYELKENMSKLPNRLVHDSDISSSGSFNDETIIDIYEKWIKKTYSIKDLDDKKIYYKPSNKNDTQRIKDKWEGIICIDACKNNCSVRFQGHLEEFQRYESEYKYKTNDADSTPIITAEDISKRSHILKERLNDTSDENDFEKKLFRLELLESAFSRVLIIDERLFSEYQCHWHDFKINGKKYRINYGNEVLPDQEDGRKIFNFSHNNFIKIAKWLRKEHKDLSCISFCCDSRKLKYVNEDIKEKILCLNENVSESIKNCIKHVSLQKLVEHIKFLYEKRKDYYKFYLKNIEIGNILSTKEIDKISFVNLEGKPLFSLKKEDNRKLSLNWDNEALNKFHFFSLHLGIIDKIRETLSCSESDIIRAFDSSLQKTYFILHTGRGKTLQTNDYPVRFMDFTTLNNWVNESKWMFVQGLYSIKKQIYK